MGIKKPKQLIEKQIVYEDNHLLVVNKPAGIPTMGAGEGESSLVNLAKSFLKKKYNKPGNVFLGVVSRIDSFVSGVIVFAKTSKAASRISSQFRDATVKKSYLAVLEGVLHPQKAKLIHWMKKNDRLRKMEAFQTEQSNSQRAELNYRVLGTFAENTLAEINLITGRKHQIRCQFSELGHPVFGDGKYDARHKLTQSIALHCRSLKLTHPTRDESMVFSVRPPDFWKTRKEIKPLLRFLGKKSS